MNVRADQLEAEYRIRQQDIAPVQDMTSLPVHMIGAGGIGSNFCVAGAKLGFQITTYDGDEVGPENVNAQIFGPVHLGRPKVDAVRDLCLDLAGVRISTIHAFVKGGEPVSGIVVEAVDSMQARQDLWNNAISPRSPWIQAFISIRMGAESGTIITLNPNLPEDQIWYEANGLYADHQAIDLPCTGRAVSYCAVIGAALGVQQVKRILMRQKVYRRIEFDLAGLMFTVEE
jgi:hypothetical protein